MDTQSVKKRAKLVELKNKLLDGQHVQNRQLKTWLGDDAFEQMEMTGNFSNLYVMT